MGLFGATLFSEALALFQYVSKSTVSQQKVSFIHNSLSNCCQGKGGIFNAVSNEEILFDKHAWGYMQSTH